MRVSDKICMMVRNISIHKHCCQVANTSFWSQKQTGISIFCISLDDQITIVDHYIYCAAVSQNITKQVMFAMATLQKDLSS